MAAQILQHVIIIQVQIQMMAHVLIQKQIMIVLGIVPQVLTALVYAVAQLQMMNAVFVMVITHHAQTVQVFQMEPQL